jgi:hypothetical protein
LPKFRLSGSRPSPASPTFKFRRSRTALPSYHSSSVTCCRGRGRLAEIAQGCAGGGAAAGGAGGGRADPTIYDKDRVLTGCRTMHRGLTRLVLAALLPAIVLCGCATVAPVNPRIDRVAPETGYRIAKFLVRDRGSTNNPDALLLLAFSGGGTRAAALSYGVLEELRRTPIVVKGHQHPLLDEVDLNWVAGFYATRAPIRFFSSALRRSRKATLRRPRSQPRPE